MTTSPASSGSELVQRVADNLATLRARIAATGRDPASIRIVAVTKTFGVEAVDAAALANGLGDVGENYVEELEAKSRRRVADLDAHLALLGRGAVEQDRAHHGVRATCSRVRCRG